VPGLAQGEAEPVAGDDAMRLACGFGALQWERLRGAAMNRRAAWSRPSIRN